MLKIVVFKNISVKNNSIKAISVTKCAPPYF